MRALEAIYAQPYGLSGLAGVASARPARIP